MIVTANDAYRSATFYDQVEQLMLRYPFIERHRIGESVLGQQIVALRIGQGDIPIHYNGAVHANEWMTSLLLMRFIEDYAAAYETNKKLRGHDMNEWFERISLWIVPMVNPDGVDLVIDGATLGHPYDEQLINWNDGSTDFSPWKANIRGVDLNDQFPAQWELEKERRQVSSPARCNYVGVEPLHEPEARALYEFTLEHSFELVMSFHTQGEEIYWNYNDHEPAYAEQMAARLAASCHYKAVKLSGSDAGYKDWFIQAFRRPGFTVEAGLGMNPLPLSDFSLIYDRIINLMLAGMREALSIKEEKG